MHNSHYMGESGNIAEYLYTIVYKGEPLTYNETVAANITYWFFTMYFRVY